MNKKIRIISLTVIILLVVLEIWMGLQVWQLNIIPFKYFLLIAAALVLLDLLIARLLLVCKKKNIVLRRALGYFLSVLVVVALFMARQAISKVQETMDAVTKEIQVNAVFEVYVLNENSIDSIENAANYTIAMTKSVDPENTSVALEALEEIAGENIKSKNYNTIFSAVNALFANEVDALLINSVYVDILLEMEGYMDFQDRVKCIWEYDVYQTVEEPDVENVVEAQVLETESKYTPFVVYISGSDTRSKKLKTSRSDVNILAVVNPRTEQILLINTPRDYYIGNPAGNGALDKLTHCGIYGVDCSMEALSILYDAEIKYYGQINFTGFEKLIDAVGGVDVYSDTAFTVPRVNYSYSKGMNHLNGSQALFFARERYRLSGGDNARGQNQMKVIKAVIDQISAGNVIINYSEILDSLQGMFATNISADMISELVKLQISEMIHWDVKSYAVTGTGDSQRTYSMPGANAYVMRPNQETVDLAKEMIDKVMAGEVLSDEDLRIFI